MASRPLENLGNLFQGVFNFHVSCTPAFDSGCFHVERMMWRPGDGSGVLCSRYQPCLTLSTAVDCLLIYLIKLSMCETNGIGVNSASLVPGTHTDDE